MRITASILNNGTAQRLSALPLEFQREAIPEILRRIADVTYTAIFANLSGAHSASAGSFPVPIRTGNLRRLLDRLYPGKRTGSLNEAFIVDTAIYADNIPQAPAYMEAGVDNRENAAIGDDVISRLVGAL